MESNVLMACPGCSTIIVVVPRELFIATGDEPRDYQRRATIADVDGFDTCVVCRERGQLLPPGDELRRPVRAT